MKQYTVEALFEVSFNANGSHFLVIYGKHGNGGFCCIPNWGLGCETPLYIADKFRGYSYTALLEMSKAKTIRGSGGIEKILTPKDSVSKIKEVRPLWNKYLEDNGTLPDCKTADEFLELVKKPAPAPLLELVECVETPEPEENRVQSIGLTEPEEPEQADEEFEAELNETAELVTLLDDELIEYVLKEGNHIDKFKLQDTVLNIYFRL